MSSVVSPVNHEQLVRSYLDRYGVVERHRGFVRDFPPLLKFGVCFAAGIACVVTQDWQFGLGVIIVSLVFAATAGVVSLIAKALAVLFASLLVLTAIVRIWSNLDAGGPVAFVMFGIAVPWAAIDNVADFMFMMHGFIAVMLLFFLTTPTRDITYALERVGMKPVASFMVLASFSSVTSILERVRVVTESQRARGLDIESSWWRRVRGVLPVLLPIIVSSLTSVEDRTLAMNARAFAARGAHTNIRRIRAVTARDWAIAVFALVVIIGCVIAHVLIF